MGWRLSGVLAMAVACSMPRGEQGRRDASTTARFAAIVEQARDELVLQGVSVVILRGDTIVSAMGRGLADMTRGTASDERTIYPVGSLSMQVTAALVMKLVERGQLALDVPVASYLLELRDTTAGTATLRQLLQQRSGIPAWDNLPETQPFLEPDATRAPTAAELIAAIAHAPALYAPGTWWSKSNSNYTLLALAIERVTQRPFDDVLRETVMAPLGLEIAACTADPPGSSGRRAAGYERERDGFVDAPLTPAKLQAFRGAGGLCASAVAVARWTRALVRHQVVSRASFDQMTRVSAVAGFIPPYGFGVSLVPIDDEQVIWHMGMMGGFVAVNAHWPGHDLVIVAIANTRRVWLQELVKRLARAELQLPAARLLDLPVPVDVTAHVVGDYDDAMFSLRVFADQKHLFVETPFGPPLRLRYQGGHRFATSGPEALRLYFDPRGHLEWEWGELRAYARRRPWAPAGLGR